MARRTFSTSSLRSLPSFSRRSNSAMSTSSTASLHNNPNSTYNGSRSLHRSRGSFGSLISNSSATSEFEADMLRGNVKRDCMCSRDGTNNFVMNPLFTDDDC